MQDRISLLLKILWIILQRPEAQRQAFQPWQSERRGRLKIAVNIFFDASLNRLDCLPCAIGSLMVP